MQSTYSTTRSTSMRVIIAACLSTVLAILPVYLAGALAVFIQNDLQFSERQLGAAVSIFYAVSAVSSLPGGRIGEWLGASRAVRLAAIGSALAAALTALLATSWAHIAVLLALAGIANAVAQPAANLALAREIVPGRQGFAFGLKQASGPATTLVAGLAVPMIGLTVGWRWAYVLCLLFAAATYVLIPKRGRPPRPQGGDRREGDMSAGPLLFLAAASSLAVGSASTLGAFFVASAVAQGHTPGTAGVWLAIGSFASIAIRVLLGWRADRREGGNLTAVIGLLLVGAVGFLLLGYAAPLAVLAPATVVAFAAGWGWPGLYQFAVVRLNPRAPGEATGVLMLGMFAGGTVGPFVFGATVERYSYQAGWILLAALLVGAAALIEAARRSVRRDLHRRRSATASVGAVHQHRSIDTDDAAHPERRHGKERI